MTTFPDRLYSDNCETDKDALNTASNTSFECRIPDPYRGDSGFLAGCTADNVNKVTAFVELGGCHGNGDYVPSGSSGGCTCRTGASDCTGRGTFDVDSPDCTCACDATYTGVDCSEQETQSYQQFY